MAITAGVFLDEGAASTGATFWSPFAFTTDIAEGQIIIFGFSTDNPGGTGGATNYHTTMSNSDFAANGEFTKLYEYTRTSGAADDGVTVSLWMFRCTTAFTATGNPRIDFS